VGERAFEVILGRHHGPDLTAGDDREVFEDVDVVRVVHGYDEPIVFMAQGQHLVLPQRVIAEASEYFAIHLVLGQLRDDDVLQLQTLSQRLGHVGSRHEPERDHYLSQVAGVIAPQVESLQMLLRGDLALRAQYLTDFLLGDPHGPPDKGLLDNRLNDRLDDARLGLLSRRDDIRRSLLGGEQAALDLLQGVSGGDHGGDRVSGAYGKVAAGEKVVGIAHSHQQTPILNAQRHGVVLDEHVLGDELQNIRVHVRFGELHVLHVEPGRENVRQFLLAYVSERDEYLSEATVACLL